MLPLCVRSGRDATQQRSPLCLGLVAAIERPGLARFLALRCALSCVYTWLCVLRVALVCCVGFCRGRALPMRVEHLADDAGSCAAFGLYAVLFRSGGLGAAFARFR